MIYLHFILLGMATGAIYVGLGSGLLTIHRASGVINFAQGAMAMWGAYVFAELRSNGRLVLPVGTLSLGDHVPLVAALAVGVVFSAVLGLLAHLLVFRPLSKAPALAQVTASIALMIAVQAAVILRFGANTVQSPNVLPTGTVMLDSLAVPEGDVAVAAVAGAVTAALWIWFRYTNAGTATRASAMNPRGATLMGFSPNRLGSYAWSISIAVSGLLVMLAAPATGLNPQSYTLYVVPALAVLLVARVDSLLAVAVGGLAFGSFQSVITLLASKSWWPGWAQTGVQDAVPFVVVVVVLFVFGGRLPSRGALEVAGLPSVRAPRLTLRGLVAGLAVGSGALLVTHGTYRFGVETSMALGLVALSYVIIVGFVGQISLAQISFAGAAGFALSKFTTNWHLPFPLGLLLAAGIAAAFGTLIAIPALRIRGAQLAIVTVAAAVAIQQFVLTNPSLTPVSGNPIGSPRLFGLNLAVRQGADISRLAFGLMVLAVTAVVGIVFVLFAGGETGRSFLAVRSNERAAASAGLSVRTVKLLAFTFSAFVAGIAGCLIGFSRGQLSADSFTIFVGMEMLAVAYLGGITSFSGAMVAGLLGPLGLVYVLLNNAVSFGRYYQLVAGLLLLLSVIFNPEGIAGKLRLVFKAIGHRTSFTSRSPSPAEAPEDTPSPQEVSSVS